MFIDKNHFSVRNRNKFMIEVLRGVDEKKLGQNTTTQDEKERYLKWRIGRASL